MLPLENLQRAFAAHLLRQDVSILRGLIDDGNISSAGRMNVYVNNVRESLSAALSGIYPVVNKLVGSEFFQFLFDQYVRLHPARSGDLRDFGRYLPDFLVSFESTAALPYLADVARLEWAYHTVFHASSPTHFKHEALAGIAPAALPNLKFRLGSACRILHSQYPIFRIWEVNQEGYAGDGYTSLDEGAQSVLVVRQNKIVELWRLDPAESAFIKSLNSGNSLGRAVETALVRTHDFDLETLLRKCVQSGALVFENFGVTGKHNTANQVETADDAASWLGDTLP